jgi:hypothetical protein
MIDWRLDSRRYVIGTGTDKILALRWPVASD